MKVGDIVVCMDKAYENVLVLGQQLKVVAIEADTQGNYYLLLDGYPDGLFPESVFQVVNLEDAPDPVAEIHKQLSHWRSEWIQAENEDNTEAVAKCLRYLDFFLDKLNIQHRYDEEAAAAKGTTDADT